MKRTMKKITCYLILLSMVTTFLPVFQPEIKVNAAENIDVGDYIQFGRYLGKPILWRVINKNEDNSLMLFSEDILCLKAFDAKGDTTDGRDDKNGYRVKYGSNYWEKSNLREWLNSEDAKVEFSHQKPDTYHVENYNGGPGFNPYDTEPGFLNSFTQDEINAIKPTINKVFLSEVDVSEKQGGTVAYNQYFDYESQFSPGEFYIDKTGHGQIGDFDIILESFLAAGDNVWVYTPEGRTNPMRIKSKSNAYIEMTFDSSTYHIKLTLNSSTQTATGTIPNDSIKISIREFLNPAIIEDRDLGAYIKIINNSEKRIDIAFKDMSKKVVLVDRNGNSVKAGSELEKISPIKTGKIYSNFYDAYYKYVTDRVFLLDTIELSEYIYKRGWNHRRGYGGEYYQYWLRNPNGDNGSSVYCAEGIGQATSFAYNGRIGVAPALNLKPGILASKGDGSLQNPYVVTGKDFAESAITKQSLGSLPSTSNYIVIADSSNEFPIEGAEVILGQKSLFTDANGIAKFDNAVEGEYDLYILKNGYQSYYCKHKVVKGRMDVFYLKYDPEPSKQYITSVNLYDGRGNYDILKCTNAYREITDESNIEPVDYCTITIKADWKGKTPKKYYLYQAGRIVLENTTGVFENILVGKLFKKVNNIPDQQVYAYVQAMDDSFSEPVKVKLETYKSVENEPYGIGTIKLGKLTSLTLPENLPVIGGTDISFELDFIPVDVLIDKDTFKIAIGVENIKEHWSEFKETISDAKEAIKDVKEYNKFRKAMSKYGKTSSTRVTKEFKPDIALVGFVEGKIKNGDLKIVNSAFIIDAEAEAKYITQYIVGPVPLYLDIGCGLNIKLSQNITGIDPETGYIVLERGTEITPSFSVGTGLGVVGVLTVGAEGSAELTFILQKGEEPLNISLEGSMSLKATALIFEAEKKIAHGIWPIYPKPFWEKEVASMNNYMLLDDFNMYETGNYQLMSRNYINNPSVWLGEKQDSIMALAQSLSQSSSNKELKLLQTNIYPDAQPKLVNIGNKQVMVWLSDNASRTAQNRTMLVYSVYNKENDSWSAPKAVSDDGTADFYPQLASDGDNLYVIWQNSNKIFNTGVTLEECAGAGEIAVSKFNSTSNTFETAVTLTSNTTCDTLPHIAVRDNKAFAVWVNNNQNDIFGINGSNTIYCSVLENGKWSAPSVISDNLSAVSAITAGYMNNSFKAAYVLDTDNQLTTINDREIYITGPDAKVTRLTNNEEIDSNPVFANINNTSALFWYSNDNIMYITDLAETPKKIFNEPQHGLADSYKIINNSAGKTAAIWAYTKEGTSEIYSSIYNEAKGDWSEIVRITDTGSKVQYPDGVFDNDGNFAIAYNRMSETSENKGQSDLCLVKITPSHNLAVNGVYFEDDELIPGTQMPLEVEVTNKGELDIENIKVEVLDSNNTNNTSLIKQRIKPGESKTINTILNVPDTISKKDYTIRVTPAEGEEYDLSDNTDSFTVGYTNISLSLDNFNIDDKEAVIVNISNSSYVPTNAVLNIREDSMDGNILDTTPVKSIRAGENTAILYEIDRTKLNFNDDIKVLHFTLEADEEELYISDNSEFIVLDKPETSNNEVPVKYGDINDDGKVNSTDYSLLKRYLLGLVEKLSSPSCEKAADLNGDNKINSTDYSLLKRFLLGIIEVFPVENKN